MHNTNNFVPSVSMIRPVNILFSLLFIFFCFAAKAQKMTISGTVADTVAGIPLQHGIAMTVRVRDSVLLAFDRTDVNGKFRIETDIDTVQVILSGPGFGEMSYYIFGSSQNNVFDFGKVVLPPKSLDLKEVVIFAFKDPVYYKGDTLIYQADSFRVKPNATVEDLLRRLPGIKVDSEGKITAQGKEVDKVLVDGDEFFGSDPTVATKNLNATAVESVQLYEKKNEDVSDESKETIQVMNLTLKEDAKKGYFGKVSGASDMQKFYEGELLANKFRNKQKISVFALSSNTPRSNFGWDDIYKYGLSEEYNWRENDMGDFQWSGNNNASNGIPQTIKTGFYYSDKITKKTKITFNYAYSNNVLEARSVTRSQYFLKDTSYITSNSVDNITKTQGHSINLNIVQTLDSLTELEISPKLKVNANRLDNMNFNDFLTSSEQLTRRTAIENTSEADGYDLNSRAKLVRKFRKKDRSLIVNYNFFMKDDRSFGNLTSINSYFNLFSFPADTVDQRKENTSTSNTHSSSVIYTEPLTKKVKLEFSYDLTQNNNSQSKTTYNFFNGEYSVYDSAFSNNFENIQLTNRVGAKYIYEVKKQRFTVGTRLRYVDMQRKDLINDNVIDQDVKNILPFLSYSYKPSDNSRISFRYFTGSNQPSTNQLQPIPDNTNPNQVKIGNPGLLPTFDQKFELDYNSHKPISGKYIWTGMEFGTHSNAFANSSYIDSLGRTVSRTVNVHGNYDGNANIGFQVPLLKGIAFGSSINYHIYNTSSYINNSKNSTQTSALQLTPYLEYRSDSIEVYGSWNYSYNQTGSSLNLNSNKPYSSQSYNIGMKWLMPWFKVLLETDATYNINGQRANGYNINYLVWNASAGYFFLKNENLVLSFSCNDIFNQNISVNRDMQDNVITDTKTNIISRYYLLKLLYKFNSSKTKDEDDAPF